MNIIAGTRIPADAFAQINQQFNYITENDEHADIATGDTIIDESLVDEVMDSIQMADAEINSSEAVKDSVLQKQLTSAKDRIIEEIEEHGMPKCYHRGDLFDRPPSAIFALQFGMKKSSLDPAMLYERDVCVWIPHLLPGHPDKFNCACGNYLSRNGT